jgi:hypothetical protein
LAPLGHKRLATALVAAKKAQTTRLEPWQFRQSGAVRVVGEDREICRDSIVPRDYVFGGGTRLGRNPLRHNERQIGNLCCGFGGQAYALLNLYKHTGDKAWLHRAQAQAQRAARSILEMPGEGDYKELAVRAESLYKGELGVAVLAAELDRPEFSAMPFFEGEA